MKIEVKLKVLKFKISDATIIATLTLTQNPTPLHFVDTILKTKFWCQKLNYLRVIKSMRTYF
jgi:hypothetical protein